MLYHRQDYNERFTIVGQMFFYKPNLWWPNGMGKQSLYNVEITVGVKDQEESDSWNQQFGFRKIENEIDETTGGRYYYPFG